MYLTSFISMLCSKTTYLIVFGLKLQYNSVIIVNRSDYTKKVESMLQQGILEGKYVKTEDNNWKKTKIFSLIYISPFQNIKVW